MKTPAASPSPAPTPTPVRNIGLYVALVPAIALVGVWSLGVSALVRKEYDPALPQWVVFIAAAAVIVGVLMLIGRLLRTGPGQRFVQILLGCLLIPLFGAVFGGFYFWLARRMARDRDPVMMALLAVGLGITVFGFGIATSMEPGHMAGVFGVALAGLMALRFMFPRRPMGMTRFGALHFLSFVLVMVVASVEDERRQKLRAPPLNSGTAGRSTHPLPTP